MLNSWEALVGELPTFPWTNLHITSLKFEGFGRTLEPQDQILRILYDGLNGLKWKELGDRDNNLVIKYE